MEDQNSHPKLSAKEIWIGRVEDKSGLLQIIKDVSNGLYFVAIIQLLAGLFLSPSLIIDSLMFAIFSFLLRKFNSRVVAILLLIISSISVITTFSNNLSQSKEGGSNIVLSLIILWACVRAVYATFKLHKITENEKALNVA